MESQVWGLGLDGPVQYLQFSHEHKEVMWLSQGHRESLSGREEIFIFTGVSIQSFKGVYSLPIMSAGHPRSHKAMLHSLFDLLSTASCFFLKTKGILVVTLLRPGWGPRRCSCLPLHPLQLSPRFSSPKNCSGHQEMVGPIGVSGIYFIWIDLNWTK